MDGSRKRFLISFLSLMASLFLMFIAAVILGEPAASFVVSYNDPSVVKSVLDHTWFWLGVFVCTFYYAMLWVWFKKSEKACVEYKHEREKPRPR